MRLSLEKAINKYIKACKTTDWVNNEIYKFQFANLINESVDWNTQSDGEILSILTNSQKVKYTLMKGRGVNFIKKTAQYKDGFIWIEDVQLFRRIHNGESLSNLELISSKMTLPVLSTWIASLFPKKLYPLGTTGFDEVIHYLFDTKNEKLYKIGEEYLFGSQSFMSETEKVLKEQLPEELFLRKWNTNNEENPELEFKLKDSFSEVDWVWIVQDFYLFVHREILNLYKPKGKDAIKTDFENPEDEIIAIEGNTVLATHKRYERNSGLVASTKKKAFEKNKMLNCEVCGFSFLENYGSIGEGFIEAHHKYPLNEREEATVTKEKDLALVCSNCHRMLHRGNPTYSIEDLKQIIDNR